MPHSKILFRSAAWEKILFGSTTEHVLYQIPCNILAV